MTSPPQRSADAPSATTDGASSLPTQWEQMRLVQLALTDLLFDAHESGHTLEDIVAAWLWLDAMSDGQ